MKYLDKELGMYNATGSSAQCRQKCQLEFNKEIGTASLSSMGGKEKMEIAKANYDKCLGKCASNVLPVAKSISNKGKPVMRSLPSSAIKLAKVDDFVDSEEIITRGIASPEKSADDRVPTIIEEESFFEKNKTIIIAVGALALVGGFFYFKK